MKGLLKSKLVLSFAAFVMMASVIAMPLAGNIMHSHAQGPASVNSSPTQGPAGTPPQTSSSGSSHIASGDPGGSVLVPATAQWVNTGILLKGEDRLQITATGSWTPGSGFGTWGPDGSPQLWPDNFLDLQDIGSCAFCATTPTPHFAALIGYIGNAPPAPGSYTSTNILPEAQKVFFVGSNFDATITNIGTLWLNFNDDAYSNFTFDNAGQVTATVTTTPQSCVQPQPGPGPFNSCVNTDPADTTTTQSETNVAVSSVNSPGITVMVVYNDRRGNEDSGYSFSYDGGTRWQDGGVFPHPSDWLTVGDPVVTVDMNGFFYVAQMAEKKLIPSIASSGLVQLFVTLNRCTDSRAAGIQCEPAILVSDMPTILVIGGKPVAARAANDKPGIAYDPVNNRVDVTWTHDTGPINIFPFPAFPGTNTIRLRYYDASAAGPLDSSHLSKTYDLYTSASGSVNAGLNGSYPVVTSDGIVHVFFESGLDSNTNHQIVYINFSGKGTLSGLFILADVTVTGSSTFGCSGNAYHTQAFDTMHAARTNEYPIATVDNNGNIDVVWNTGSPSATAGESVISIATLVGGTGKPNIQVLPDKQDSQGIPLIQWQPTVAVAGGTNTLVVTYFQTVQLADGTYQLERDQMRASASSNPTFGLASLISTQLWKPNQTNPPLDEDACYMGDYNGSASTPTANVVWVYWGDSRDVTTGIGPQADVYGLPI
jgi:hypothetical protein